MGAAGLASFLGGSCVRARGKQAISGWQAISSSLVAALTQALGLLVTQAAAAGGAGLPRPFSRGTLSPAHPSTCPSVQSRTGLPNTPAPSLFASPPPPRFKTKPWSSQWPLGS